MEREVSAIWVCSHCRLPLTELETLNPDGTSGSEWFHATPGMESHSPQPVLWEDIPGREVITHCDLCSTPSPQNLWLTGSAGGMLRIGSESYEIRDRDNQWLICDACQPDVENNNLKACFARLIDNVHERDPDFELSYPQRVLMFQRMQGFFNSKTVFLARRKI